MLEEHMSISVDFLPQHENNDVEYKAAQGKDGDGEVPMSLWETYSAMANTDGGLIVLGVKQTSTGLDILGIKNPEKVISTLWTNVNNRQITNINLLHRHSVKPFDLHGKTVVIIEVPRATRIQRPVHIGKNPLEGTYKRNHDGDYLCNETTVKRMIAEAVEETRDSRLLSGFGLNDLDSSSLAAYRNEFRSTKPGHPWLANDDKELLRCLGGWMIDRGSGEEGLTLAGLIMFGKQPSILEAFPTYIVDYQERPLPPEKTRWLDRITTDGTWSGNIYDFYRRVYPKLVSELKVPFRLESATKRIDETEVHEALREAFVNTLIHADFTGRVGILVVKRPDFFGFRNPGGLRLPLEVILKGGTSDCRNRALQKMFQLIGEGEQAGSGIEKILKAWKEQHWRVPLLYEESEPEQTVLRLSMVSLLPKEAVETLDRHFGSQFRQLSETERIAVVTAYLEGKVTNERMRACTPEHPSDLTIMFRHLTDLGILESSKSGRWTEYNVVGLAPKEATDAKSLQLFDSVSIPLASNLRKMSMLERERELKVYLVQNGTITATAYSGHFGVSPRQARSDLKKFFDGGLIKKINTGPATAYALAEIEAE
jgi:ATP-dependent DNA helicase RecG